MILSTGRSARKILLYSHDTFGLGHLSRNLAIATHLLGRRPGRQVVLLTGSTVSDHFVLPPGLSVVKLPPVVKVAAEVYRPCDPALSVSLVRRIRTAVITDVACRMRPDVLLVDHAPAGMGGELREVFEQLRLRSPRTRLALGLRDILDEPEAVRATWREQGIHHLVDETYDELYVYGSRDVFDLGEAYDLSARSRQRLTYCGYIDKPPPTAMPEFDVPSISTPYLFATAGGGGDGGAVLAAAIEAAGSVGIRPLVITGPLMDSQSRRMLGEKATGAPGTTIVAFHPSMRAAMEGASVVVTMGGYNSLCEAVATGTPTVVVPRVSPRLEQAMRAERFAARGLVDAVLPGADLAGRLASAVRRAVTQPPPARRPLDLTGLHRLEMAIDQIATGSPPADLVASAVRQTA